MSIVSAKLNDFRPIIQNGIITPLQFGATGDGRTDDSQAFLKAIQAAAKNDDKILVIPHGYVFNLVHQTIDFNKFNPAVVMKFDGGVLKNAKFVGNRTRILAPRIKIFENIILSGTFSSLSDYAYPEWVGGFPYDNTIDLVDALRQLDSVFFDIQLSNGEYFTKKGKYEVRGLTGISVGTTHVIMETDQSNTFLFSMGKISGSVKDRDFHSRYIRNLSLHITSTSRSQKLRGNRGIIIGATHRPVIENVRLVQSRDYQRFEKFELQSFLVSQKKVDDANVNIEFKGDSELSILNNISSYADVGIMFTQYTDMATVTDYAHDCLALGLATVYFKKEAVQSQNLIFNGTQSWNRGLYGFYSEDSNLWNAFRSNRFENVRIEQLTKEIVDNGKVVSTSIRIGKSNLISNMIFENIILSGASNGIYIGETASGNIYFDKVFLNPDVTIKRAFAFKTKLLPPASNPDEQPFKIHLKNMNLYQDAPSFFENSRYLPKQENKNRFLKNIFLDETIEY